MIIFDFHKLFQLSINHRYQDYLDKSDVISQTQYIYRMTSKIKGPNGKATTNQRQHISSFHLIVWLFAVNQVKSEFQKKQIDKMYGDGRSIINVWIRDKRTFKRTMQNIENSNNECKIKILLDWDMYDVLINSCLRQERIIEIYVWDSKGEFNHKVNIEKPLKPIYPLYSIDEAFKMAEEQVEKWTKPYKTFQNTFCLAEKPDKINKFRYILIAFINMRISDFQVAFKKFKDLVQLEIPGLKAHQNYIQMKNKAVIQQQPLEKQKKQEKSDLQNEEQFFAPQEQKMIKEQALEKLQKQQKQERIPQAKPQESLQKKKQKPVEYYQGLATLYSSYFIQAEKFHQKSLQSHTQAQLDDFYNFIMKFYQNETFFYPIFNSNIKMLEKDGFNRMGLMLPFTHVFNSVKWLFHNQVRKKNKFYLNPFSCYRATRCKVSQLENLQKILEKKQEQQRTSKKKDNIYIEMTGTFSTSQSAALVLKKFSNFKTFQKQLNKKQREPQRNLSQEHSQQVQNESERQVIYRIKVEQIFSKIDPERYDLFIPGFFKMTERQNQKALSEKQIFFNALNVLRLVSIQLLDAGDLLSTEQKQEHKQKMKLCETKQTQDNDSIIALDAFYKTKITVIDLELGPFYDALLETNRCKLGKYELEARLNYVHCMNKIKKYHKFDYTDACFLLNEHEKCYELLKEKIKHEQSVCIKDGKNYFEQIAKICRMLGRISEAIKYTNLAIQCHRQLEEAHLSNVYDTHYDALLEMQLDAIQFYQECFDLKTAQNNLERTFQEFQATHKQGHQVKIKQSELLINIGINFYSKGRLDESSNSFKKCQQGLLIILQQCLPQPQIPCYFSSFLLNIFRKDEDNQKRYCSYTQYGERLREKLINKSKKELEQSNKDLFQTSEKASAMLQLTQEAIKNRRIFLKNNKNKYIRLVKCEKSKVKKENNQKSNTTILELVNNIKHSVAAIKKRKDFYSQQFQKQMEKLKKYQNDLDQLKINFAFEVEEDEHMDEYIKKFKKRVLQEKRVQLQNKNKNAKDFRQDVFLKKFMKCAEDIEKNIEQLKSQGFVDSTTDVMRQRNNLAKIFQKGQQRQKALEEIKKIIGSILVENENRFMEYATAYFTRGRIQFDMNKFSLAINSFRKSLEQYQKYWQTQNELNKKQKEQNQKLDQMQKDRQQQGNKKEKSQKKEVKQEQKDINIEEKAEKNEVLQEQKVQQKQIEKIQKKEDKRLKEQWQKLNLQQINQNILQQSDNDDDFQMVKIMWIKAKLKYLQLIDDPQNRQQNLSEIQGKILQINNIILKRKNIQDREELTSSLNEVHIYYLLHKKNYKDFYEQQKRQLFDSLKEMVRINIKHEGQSSIKNILVYCQLIFQFNEEQYFLSQLSDQTDCLEKLKKQRVQCINQDTKWKISKALYFLNLNIRQYQQARKFLNQAIKILMALFQDNNKKHLKFELDQLERIGKISGLYDTKSTNIAQSWQNRPPSEKHESSRDQLK